LQKTWKPVVGGVCGIVAGSAGVLTGTAIGAFGAWWPLLTPHMNPWTFSNLGLLGWPLLILGIVAIVGGIFAIQRKLWGLALAGSICAVLILPASLLGVLAVVFVSLARSEFERPAS